MNELVSAGFILQMLTKKTNCKKNTTWYHLYEIHKQNHTTYFYGYLCVKYAL